MPIADGVPKHDTRFTLGCIYEFIQNGAETLVLFRHDLRFQAVGAPIVVNIKVGKRSICFQNLFPIGGVTFWRYLQDSTNQRDVLVKVGLT